MDTGSSTPLPEEFEIGDIVIVKGQSLMLTVHDNNILPDLEYVDCIYIDKNQDFQKVMIHRKCLQKIDLKYSHLTHNLK